MKPKKILRIPLRILETVIENKTGLDLDISEIFWTSPETGSALDVALAVSMPDGLSARILWDPDGPVSSSQLIAIVQSIVSDRQSVTSIQVNTPPTSSPVAATPSEPLMERISPQLELFDQTPEVKIFYSDIEEYVDA